MTNREELNNGFALLQDLINNAGEDIYEVFIEEVGAALERRGCAVPFFYDEGWFVSACGRAAEFLTSQVADEMALAWEMEGNVLSDYGKEKQRAYLIHKGRVAK